ncbi:imelysin family protein [Marinobacter nanhaiticus D15-8W]|nr:imelysin family protein [Marinobacter nanhaiticus]BES70520.1 imelysin family protein [Marinobacter nanhaiticus D15-8W]
MPGLRHLIPALAIVIAPLLQAAESPRAQWQTDIAAGYETLAEHVIDLHQTTQTYCEAPSPENRAHVENAWKSAFLQWQRVRFVDFGPIEQNSRAWQIQFWPDTKNLVARKVGFALDQNTADEQQVAEAGVALQGFPAMEYLLFDTRMNQADDALPAERTCALLTAIAGHLAATTGSLSADWQRFSSHFLETDSYTARTVEAGLNGLEILLDRRLADPMGLRGTPKRNPYLGDAWRSGYSLAAIRASIQGMDRYLRPGLDRLLTQQGHQELAEKLDKQFESTLEELDALPDALAPSLEDDAKYRGLQSLFIEVTQLEQVLENRIAPALGIRRGFNSSDGD